MKLKLHQIPTSDRLCVLAILALTFTLSVNGASVIFVTDVTQHIDGDDSVIDRLEFLGHEIEIVDHLDVLDTDAVAIGADLIVISSSSTSTNVLDHFSEDPIPIINWEENLWDDLYMSDRGMAGDHEAIDVVDLSHPLAAIMGLTDLGELIVLENGPRSLHYGGIDFQAPGLNVIAIEAGGDRTAIGVIDAGAELNDGSTAAATRIGLFLGDLALFDATDEGFAIFDGAISYALGGGDVGDPGDFDQDGDLDADDISALAMAILDAGAGPEFDVNGDGSIDPNDHKFWIKELKNTWVGDVNLDGEFSSSDFVAVFQAGEYEDAVVGNSTWATGDWNGDQDFTSGDFVAAFQDGGFEQGPRVASVVPEPTSFAVPGILLALLLFSARRSIRFE